MGLTRRNFQRAARKMTGYGRFAGLTVGGALKGIGEEIMTDVKASRPGHGVPVDEGTLRDSGRVSPPQPGPKVTLSFGGASAPYAVIQHENMSYHHDVGEPRYLVRGVQRWKPRGSAAANAWRAHLNEAAKRAARP